jgi:hypothetical protein
MVPATMLRDWAGKRMSSRFAGPSGFDRVMRISILPRLHACDRYLSLLRLGEVNGITKGHGEWTGRPSIATYARHFVAKLHFECEERSQRRTKVARCRWVAHA